MVKPVLKLYNDLFCEENIRKVQKVIVFIAVTLFILHLVVIWFNNLGLSFLPIVSALGENYLSAVFTPFAVILLFEVYLLIAAIPNNITTSIIRQYQVISLIVLWGVFKDASDLTSVEAVSTQGDILMNIGLDIVAAVVLFALVAAFKFTGKICEKDEDFFVSDKSKLLFVNAKKTIALTLSVILVLLGMYYFFGWVIDVSTGSVISIYDVQDQYFSTLFTVMIFTDVLIVLLSYAFMEKYQVVYRNAMFIISTILIRFSLTADAPLDLLLAVGAVFVGILVNIVYGVYSRFGK